MTNIEYLHAEDRAIASIQNWVSMMFKRDRIVRFAQLPRRQRYRMTASGYAP